MPGPLDKMMQEKFKRAQEGQEEPFDKTLKEAASKIEHVSKILDTLKDPEASPTKKGLMKKVLGVDIEDENSIQDFVEQSLGDKFKDFAVGFGKEFLAEGQRFLQRGADSIPDPDSPEFDDFITGMLPVGTTKKVTPLALKRAKMLANQFKPYLEFRSDLNKAKTLLKDPATSKTKVKEFKDILKKKASQEKEFSKIETDLEMLQGEMDLMSEVMSNPIARTPLGKAYTVKAAHQDIIKIRTKMDNLLKKLDDLDLIE